MFKKTPMYMWTMTDSLTVIHLWIMHDVERAPLFTGMSCTLMFSLPFPLLFFFCQRCLISEKTFF